MAERVECVDHLMDLIDADGATQFNISIGGVNKEREIKMALDGRVEIYNRVDSSKVVLTVGELTSHVDNDVAEAIENGILYTKF